MKLLIAKNNRPQNVVEYTGGSLIKDQSGVSKDEKGETYSPEDVSAVYVVTTKKQSHCRAFR